MEDVNASSFCDLGRKEYWEDFYSKELENFEEYGDEGIRRMLFRDRVHTDKLKLYKHFLTSSVKQRFGKKNVERIVNWMLENNIDRSLPVLDVGCGNGMTLVALFKKGFRNLTGIDYAEEAIQLAQNVAKTHEACIQFQVLDFLEEINCLSKQAYHIIIDKGTYDAISLSPNDSKSKRLKYINRIKELLHSDGFFILFSCNWTKDELLHQFVGFTVHDEINIPSIGFGGKTGQTVTALILKSVM